MKHKLIAADCYMVLPDVRDPENMWASNRDYYQEYSYHKDLYTPEQLIHAEEHRQSQNVPEKDYWRVRHFDDIFCLVFEDNAQLTPPLRMLCKAQCCMSLPDPYWRSDESYHDYHRVSWRLATSAERELWRE